MLDNKKLVITGVITKDSIAWEVARRAQQDGAEIVLTSFGRARRLTERAAKSLPEPPDVLELDVNDTEHLTAVAAELQTRWGRVDGILHAIAFAPEDALGGRFLQTPANSAITAFETSAFSLKALGAALADLYPEEGASIVVCRPVARRQRDHGDDHGQRDRDQGEPPERARGAQLEELGSDQPGHGDPASASRVSSRKTSSSDWWIPSATSS